MLTLFTVEVIFLVLREMSNSPQTAEEISSQVSLTFSEMKSQLIIIVIGYTAINLVCWYIMCILGYYVYYMIPIIII